MANIGHYFFLILIFIFWKSGKMMVDIVKWSVNAGYDKRKEKKKEEEKELRKDNQCKLNNLRPWLKCHWHKNVGHIQPIHAYDPSH